MGNSILKEKLHKVVDSADPELLELLYSTAREYKDSVSDLNFSQLAELKRCLDHFESGEMKFGSDDKDSDEVMSSFFFTRKKLKRMLSWLLIFILKKGILWGLFSRFFPIRRKCDTQESSRFSGQEF